MACGACVERCQMDALLLGEETVKVDEERCIGCGVCAIVCPEGALAIVRHSSEISPSPESFMDWMVQQATNRGVDPSDLL